MLPSVAMPTKMFVNHLTSVMLMLRLSFQSFENARVEAVGEFEFLI